MKPRRIEICGSDEFAKKMKDYRAFMLSPTRLAIGGVVYITKTPPDFEQLIPEAVENIRKNLNLENGGLLNVIVHKMLDILDSK